MNIYIALVIVSAIYAGALALLCRSKYEAGPSSPLDRIDTKTIKGRKAYIAKCQELAKKARESAGEEIEG